VLASIDPWAAALTGLAMLAVFRLRLGMFVTLALLGGAGVALKLVGLI